MAFVEQASPRPPPAHGRRSAGRRAHRGSARARLHTAPGRALDGAAGARELTSDDGRRSPVTRPVLGRPAPRRPAPQAVGPRSRARSVFEVQSQQPGNFSLHVQDRVRGVQLVLQASHLRLERAHLRIQRVAFGRLARRASSRPTPAASPPRRALRQAASDASCTTPRGEAGGPPRRAVCSDPPPPESSQPILCGELAPLRLGHNLPGPGSVWRGRPWGPRRYAPRPPGPERKPHSMSSSLSLAVIGFYLHRPTEIPKVAWCLSDVGREGLARSTDSSCSKPHSASFRIRPIRCLAQGEVRLQRRSRITARNISTTSASVPTGRFLLTTARLHRDHLPGLAAHRRCYPGRHLPARVADGVAHGADVAVGHRRCLVA